MNKRNLEYPPLKEVILDIRWNLANVPAEMKKDSQILAGILLEKVKGEYRFHEPLDISKMPLPEDMVNGIVQHRFRVGANQWPLIQIGAGVFTVNDSNDSGDKYDWADFKRRCLSGLKTLVDVYPISDAVESINLKYVNTIPFNFEENNIFSFLKEKMKVDVVSLPNKIYETIKAEEKPLNFNFTLTHSCNEPNTLLKIQIASGKNNGEDSLILNIDITADKLNIPSLPDGLDEWLETVHSKIEEVFFTLIENLNDTIN